MTGDNTTTDEQPIMELRNLCKYFDQDTSIVKALADTVFGRNPEKIRAVDDLTIDLQRNTVEGIIGESGCGKTTLLMTLIDLYSPTEGEMIFDGRRTSEFDKADWKEFKRRVQIIFQDPFNAMDPKHNVRETLKEPLDVHDIGDKDRRIREILERVELNPPERYLARTPQQLSGGEKQRVAIGRALILEPDVILADEPVSMLDVSTQAAILRLLENLIDEMGVSMFYISHDLSTVSYICDRVNVMYLGRIVESQPTQELLENPMHPYTQALIGAIPLPDPHVNRERTSMEGRPSDPIDLPPGCRFKDRCPERMDICDQRPLDWTVEEGQSVACHLYYDHEEEADAVAVTPEANDHE